MNLSRVRAAHRTKVALQGRVRDGKSIRGFVCLACKHTWPAALIVQGRS
jgi:hypothetical protein